MKKFSVILSSALLIITLTTFNPLNFNSSFQIFEIDKIEIKNLKILKEKRIKNLFYNELYGSSLLILDKKKINSILNDNKLIEYIELKKIYPSKLQIIIHEKETIAIINFKQTKYFYIINLL